jgi:L-seryl-tRNA(Ser) seleniumtransferase
VSATADLRWLPAVHECLASVPERVREHDAGERMERVGLERALEIVRDRLRGGDHAFESRADVRRAVEEGWEAEVRRLVRPGLAPVINATGIVVHTNLGRAPLPTQAVEAAATAGARYTPLEYDLEHGERGSRYVHAAGLLRLLTGAEDALVVNNNAAALLLAVDTLAGGGEVLVSRGELIEIGGGFRVHEIVRKGSARLVEVGATNKTHASDYRKAIEEGDVRAILKVHRSNFSQEGFVAEVGLEELCSIAAEHRIPVVFDQGTGIVRSPVRDGGEPTLRSAIEAGAAIVCASGDKLLGGPQAGILCGHASAVALIRENPLLRALRVDKMTLAALEATLRLWLGDPDGVPVRTMTEADPDALERRASSLLGRLGARARERCRVVPHEGRTGGGTLPGVPLPGWAVRIEPVGSAARLEARLREGDPPIIARVAGEAVWIDVRTFLRGDEERVAARIDEIFEGGKT